MDCALKRINFISQAYRQTITVYILCISETWLNQNINNAELFSRDYKVFRSDRCLQTTCKKHGGGVAIAVVGSMVSNVISGLTISNVFDMVGVSVR